MKNLTVYKYANTDINSQAIVTTSNDQAGTLFTVPKGELWKVKKLSFHCSANHGIIFLLKKSRKDLDSATQSITFERAYNTHGHRVVFNFTEPEKFYQDEQLLTSFYGSVIGNTVTEYWEIDKYREGE